MTCPVCDSERFEYRDTKWKGTMTARWRCPDCGLGGKLTTDADVDPRALLNDMRREKGEAK